MAPDKEWYSVFSGGTSEHVSKTKSRKPSMNLPLIGEMENNSYKGEGSQTETRKMHHFIII
jgi:hypothetical protein